MEAVAASKDHILHTTATVLAGSAAPGAAELVAALEEFGGRPASTIIGWGVRVPPAHAAMANSMMGHAQDFDNNDDRTAYKTSVCAVPAGLAMAEYLGSVTGRDFLNAVCIGIDLGIRMALAVRPYPSHSQSAHLGPFVAAATAAKLMKLDEEKIWNALGLAMCGVATVGVSTAGMSYSKRFLAGCATRNGILAAQLAAKGFKAQQPIFTGSKNFYNSVWKTDADVDVLLDDLGRRFEVVNVGPKSYPSCRYTHASIDAALGVMSENTIDIDDIAEIVVTVGRRDYEVVFGGPDEIGLKQEPRSIVDAQFSIPYTVATALLHRRVFLEDFTPAAIRRQDVIALAKKVRARVDDNFDIWPATVRPCELEVATRGGRRFSKRVEYPRGNPRNAISREEVRQNFMACALHAKHSLPLKNVSDACAMIENIEEVTSVSDIPQKLSPPL